MKVTAYITVYYRKRFQLRKSAGDQLLILG